MSASRTWRTQATAWRWLAAVAVLALTLGGSLMPVSALTEQVSTEALVGLRNGLAELAFDRESGALVSLRDLTSGEQYLAEPGGTGNPFRLYLDPTELPETVTALNPWRGSPLAAEDALGGSLLEAGDCTLQDWAFERRDGAGVLRLTSHAQAAGLSFTLVVSLPDHDTAADLQLTVTNTGAGTRQVLTDFPHLSGLRLGPDRSSNLSIKMAGYGIAGEPAWIADSEVELGGVYGKQVSMQWQALYDPGVNQVLGLVVMDGEPRPKVIRRFVPAGLGVLYFPNDTLAPGASLTYPAARLIVQQGNWRPVARRYGEWFARAFPLRDAPKWFDDVDLYGGWWVPNPDAVAEAKQAPDRPGAFTSFRQLDRLYLPNRHDLLEWAMYWQGNVTHRANEVDGTYYLRSDLGGPVAMREGVARVHELGRRAMFYIATISVPSDSDLFQGTDVQDWMLMEAPGHMMDIGYPRDGISVCHGYEPWQDHVAQVARRLLWETGADGIRLDEFGTPSIPCFNPAHNHDSPYDGIQWGMELVRKVRAAMDEVNPDAILMTEAAADCLHLGVDAGGLVMFYPGRDIEPMRVALPSLRGMGYHIGAVEAALNGWGGGRQEARRTTSPGWGQWYARLPEDFPEGPGPTLRWNELAATFRAAQLHGTVTDSDPSAPEDSAWVGRLWCAEDYWVMIGGHEDVSPLAGPTAVRLLELPAGVRSAYEIDLETLQMREVPLSRGPEGITVTVTSPFGAVLLPTADCPPLVLMEDLPQLPAGGELEVTLRSFAPWGSVPAPPVRLEAPGLEVTPAQVTLPATVRLRAAAGAPAGNYYLRVTGDVLPLRRWVEVTKGG